jgi:hypothetical protein
MKRFRESLYGDGKLEFKWQYINNLRHGFQYGYKNNRSRWYICNYKNGIGNGPLITLKYEN